MSYRCARAYTHIHTHIHTNTHAHIEESEGKHAARVLGGREGLRPSHRSVLFLSPPVGQPYGRDCWQTRAQTWTRALSRSANGARKDQNQKVEFVHHFYHYLYFLVSRSLTYPCAHAGIQSPDHKQGESRAMTTT